MEFKTEKEYRAYIAQREREIARALQKAVRKAVEEFLAADANGDDKLGVKYYGPVLNGHGKFRCGFKDGIGFEVSVRTAYLPTDTVELPVAS